ncbi:MAG: hypothetical protein HQM16_18465 [Deltaproteobacteria bacterium]|nr:hypothetical protein [Deltaproteobacteria bacterium]
MGFTSSLNSGLLASPFTNTGAQNTEAEGTGTNEAKQEGTPQENKEAPKGEVSPLPELPPLPEPKPAEDRTKIRRDNISRPRTSTYASAFLKRTPSTKTIRR